MNKKIGFIGGGRITRIILQAFKNSRTEIEGIVSDPNVSVLEKLSDEFGSRIKTTTDNLLAADTDVVMICLHPPVFSEELAKIRESFAKNTLVISLAPKLTIRKIKDALGAGVFVARVIPNAPSYNNHGYNPICFEDSFPAEKRKEVVELLSPLGKMVEVEERKLEAYALITAMGPTYFWFEWQKLIELGRKFGMEESESKQAVHEMLDGAVDTFFNSGLKYEQVADLIPSKPISEDETTINSLLESKLTGFYEKIKN